MGHHDKREALNNLIDEIFQTNGLLLAEGDRLSAEQGLTGARWQVLAALHLEQCPLTVAQIARRMGLQRQSVQRLTDILVGQDILTYHANPEHKRAKLVDFTTKGRATYEQMDTLQYQHSQGITPAFTLEELQQATEILHRLRHTLEHPVSD